MDKKGQNISMNVIIVAIIALVVLVVVAAFFLGGFTNITEKIASLFRGGVSDIDTALVSCGNLCNVAESLQEGSLIGSGYCKNFFYLDVNRDGQVDKEGDKRVRYYCWSASGPIKGFPTKQVSGAPSCDLPSDFTQNCKAELEK